MIGIVPSPSCANLTRTLASPVVDRVPVPISLAVLESAPDPAKENSICLSSGLKETDSAEPLSFLNVPEPT